MLDQRERGLYGVANILVLSKQRFVRPLASLRMAQLIKRIGGVTVNWARDGLIRPWY